MRVRLKRKPGKRVSRRTVDIKLVTHIPERFSHKRDHSIRFEFLDDFYEFLDILGLEMDPKEKDKSG